MKGLITYCQNKRVSLPYIFGKYVFPEMKKRFNGELLYYHIWNCSHDPTHTTTSNKLDVANIEKVQRAYYRNMFKEAELIVHYWINNEWPGLPSVIEATELAKKLDVDFHLCMEDDAIVYDMDCDKWATILGSGDVGTYMNTVSKEMINCAYVLGTREFDNRLSLMLQEFKRTITLPCNKQNYESYNGKYSMIEHIFYRAARQPIYMGTDKAFRHHPYPTFTKTGKDVCAWLKKTIPHITKEDLALVSGEFND